MVIFSPVTVGLILEFYLSLQLGFTPSSWGYMIGFCSKVPSCASGYSEVNLVEVEKDDVKEDDRSVLLEGGGLQLAFPKARTSSAYSPVFRFMLMDEEILLENRLTLRAISEFSVLLAYFYLCDHTDFFHLVKKELQSGSFHISVFPSHHSISNYFFHDTE